MKTPFLSLLGAMCLSATAFAAVAPIERVTFAEQPSNPVRNATELSSFVSSGQTYSALRVADSVAGIKAVEWIWPVQGADPGSAAAALLDRDITSGTLNTGSNVIYRLGSLKAGDTVFYFGNYGGDNPAYAVAVDSRGNMIGQPLEIPASALSVNVAVVQVARSGGGKELRRVVRGVAFAVSDLNLGGRPVDDVAGIRFYGQDDFDVNMVGVAPAAQ